MSNGVGNSSENQLFQLCLREPNYTKNMKCFQKIEAEHKDEKECQHQKMKVFYRVWSGLSKYIES